MKQKCYSIFPLFLITFSVFSMLNFSVKAQSPSGNITYQPNTIPDVNVYYQDYSFVFEYKSYFIRIRPFVIYNGQYYNIKQIIQWIKNNYPDIDYKWLVDKAVDAIHYGFNLTKLPQNVADKIDYLGFRLVDLNFPLSYLKTKQEQRFTDDFEVYNITVIRVANIFTLSFEDLYPFGYTIQHINKTYILIGNVKGKTDLFIDPFALYNNYIYYWGGTEGSPIKTADLWQADQDNGWGEIEKDATGTSYTFSCGLYGGEDDWGDQYTTWFVDEAVQWVFDSTAPSTFLFLSGHSNNHFTLGKLTDSTLKTTSRGVDVIALNTNPYVQILGSMADANFYGTRFYAKDNDVYGSRFIDNAVGTVFYESRIEGFITWIQTTASPDVYKMTIANSTYGILSYTSSGTWNDLFIHDNDYAIRPQFNGIISDSVFSNNTKLGHYSVYAGNKFNLTNVVSDTWSFDFIAGRTGELFRQYTFDLTVTDSAEVALANADVTITHYGQSEVIDFSGTTDANGQISQQTLDRSFYNITGGDTEYSYNPYNLNIALSGYETYNQNFTLSEKTDWTKAMISSVKTDPVARFEFSPERAYVDETITFDATNSTDPDGGSISSYSWDYGDSGSGTGITDTHSYSSAGKYWVELTVTDDESATDITGLWVNITDYLAPTAFFTYKPFRSFPNNPVYFFGYHSTDRDGTISTYSWDFGDTGTGTGANVSHTYSSDGNFEVTLTVTDGEGKTNAYSRTIAVAWGATVTDGDGTTVVTDDGVQASFVFSKTVYYMPFEGFIMNYFDVDFQLEIDNPFEKTLNSTVYYYVVDSSEQVVFSNEEWLEVFNGKRLYNFTFQLPLKDGDYNGNLYYLYAYAEYEEEVYGKLVAPIQIGNAHTTLRFMITWTVIGIFIVAIGVMVYMVYLNQKRKEIEIGVVRK